MKKLIAETPRLLLQEFDLGDSAFIFRLLNTPTWLRFIGDRGIRSEEDAARYLEHGPLKSYAQHGFGLWMVRLKADDKPLGMCGLVQRAGLAGPDLGFAFLPESAGLGYAFEAAQACLHYAADVLHLAELLAITTPENERSIALLERLGMQQLRPMNLPGELETMLVFQSGRLLEP